MKIIISVTLSLLSLFFSNAVFAEVILGQDIIVAPTSVIDDPPGAVNDHQQAFSESQNVTLPDNVVVDSGFIAAGTVVDSHMIFLNTEGTAITRDTGVVWTFDGNIIGVMSDQDGNLEAASNMILGSPVTTYPGSLAARGMEMGTGVNSDSYKVTANQISVDMIVSEPGDWIRVITDPSTKKVNICHIPPGNPDNPQLISVAIPSLKAHLAHGDVVGSCPE